ncbi:NRPS [Trichoderma asperellum]|uniref:Carrier domain-containing protein n=1 Tax=Trichoderma asperellum (strain ATCC 204424 / CBS 433.97 / NBRC 101777) TaxID=1042311 RepID=A0A2T3ZCN2_TRIA4|nr:hypothetical protein M441DRAFT_456748 [Trichoderma asperellum CBS 433.97]PTB42564.1 hypothetical protein M441DRAFT_456748 [Trichoderma asperellum CBS 433.97]UKZ93432.1 NRPS [Trichoderma asperellum]
MAGYADQAITKPTTVCDLVEQWAQRQPNHIAISFGNRTVTYSELDNAATHIAWLLSEKQVKLGDKIPVLAQRGPEMVACFLGVLKAGASYIPIDTESWSEDRIQSTLKRVSARVILNTCTEEYLGYEEISHTEIEEAFAPGTERHWQRKEDRPWKRIQSTDLAYIIFTSGTTSTPKGVMIPHSALLNYVQQGGEETPFNLNATPDDTVMLIFSPAFDAATGAIMTTLCNGAELRIATTSDFLHTITLCTIVACTPSVLQTIQDPSTCSKLRTIVLGGEAPPIALVRKWAESLPTSTIYNFYGPTETTIASLVARLHADKPITLGRPMSNGRVLLLDGETESDYGEICLTGPGLARGYYENEALTAEKFVFWQGERIYRTGDFGRLTDHGLEFAGRKDSFVKNRGFLINLDAQVIPMLSNSPNVMAATAFMYRGRLVAFVTPETVDGVALRKNLSLEYDAFIIPDLIRAVEFLPLTPNGKADNRALQSLLDAESSQAVDGGLLQGISNTDSKMEILKAALSFATSIPLSDITDNSSFAELGGNSLAGLKVLSFLRTKGFHLRLSLLFDLPDLATIHDAIEKLDEGEGDTADQADAPTSGPLSTLQAKMIQAGLRNPTVNYMLLRISLPHTGKTLSGSRFQSAWRRVIERHSIFRTTFDLKHQLQEVQPELHLDWSNEETTKDQLQSIIQIRSQEMRKKISYIEHGDTFVPISAYRLITVPNIGSTLLSLVHHSIADGWSFSVILEELRLALDGKSLSDPPQFINIAKTQTRLQEDAQGNAFWDALLENSLTQPQLTLPKPPSDTPAADWSKSLQVNLGFTPEELETKARLRRITPATMIYSAWGLVLSNYSFTDRVAFGAVFSGRNIDTMNVDRVAGPLLNTLPFPLEFKEEQTVADVLSTTQSQLLQMLEFQWSSDKTVAKMPAERIANAFQTIVVMEYDLPTLAGVCEALPEPWGIERDDMMEFGISLLLEVDDDGCLRARILYDGLRYTEQSITGLLNHFKSAIKGLLDDKNTMVQDVRAKLITGEERHSLLNPPRGRVGNYQGYDTIKDAFEASAAKWPDLRALESTRGSMTYRELDEAANKLANHLRSITKPGSVVGILTDGSLHWVVAILAVLKAGCICCAIDVNLPAARIEIITQQSGATVFIAANENCARVIQNTPEKQIIVSEEFVASCKTQPHQLETISKPKDVIYLVFTSGSTGIPKGVALHNHSLLMVIDHEPTRLFSGPGRRNGQVYALGFDVVLVEIFGTICYGGTLVLKDPNDPLGHLKQVDAAHSTPSLLAALSPDEYPNLDTIGLAGEAVPQSLADAWSHKRLFNFYGPSECAPISTGTELLPGDKVTIGKAVPHLDLYLLDHHQCLVPPGITGEIYLSGEQMTRGYWNLTNQTKAAFLPNPFHPDRLMYKTGDLGCWTEDMKVAYVGRIDNQVKVRGFRIEMEEIERALVRADPAIQRAAAIVIDGIRIVAFVTPSTVDTSAVSRKVKTLLPAYACPAQVMAFESLPQSSNLKIDRKALRLMATEYKDIGDAPSSPTEKIIAEVWSQILNFEGGDKIRITRDDDFLAIGGNSLLAIKAARLISESIGYHIPMPLLIRERVLSGLAQAIDGYKAQGDLEDGLTTFRSFLSNLSSPTSLAVPQAPSELEEELYVWHTVTNTKSLLNTAFQFIIEGTVDATLLKQAVVSVIQKNPILRARYVLREGILFRLISDEVVEPLFFTGGSLDDKEFQALIDKPFDLANDQLIRAVIWSQEDENSKTTTSLSLITHHIITDKASIALLLQSVSEEYQLAVNGITTHTLSGDTSSHDGNYIEWTQWLQQNSKLPVTPEMTAKREFWKSRVEGIQSIEFLDNPETQTVDIEIPGHQSFVIPTTDSAGFSQRLALAATALTVSAVFGNTDITLGIPYMSRDEPGSANLMGLFLDRLPVRFVLNEHNMTDSARLINDITSEVNLSTENQIPYAKILQLAKDKKSLFDVMVIYHWQSDALEHSLKIPGAQILSRPIRARGAKFPLQLEFSEQQDGLHCGIEYNASNISPSQMAAIISYMPIVIKGLVSGLAPAEILSSFRTVKHINPLLAMPTFKSKIAQVCEAFSEALAIPLTEIAPDLTLFELGGTPITAIRLHYLLTERGLHCDLLSIIGKPTAKHIAWLC